MLALNIFLNIPLVTKLYQLDAPIDFLHDNFDLIIIIIDHTILVALISTQSNFPKTSLFFLRHHTHRTPPLSTVFALPSTSSIS